MLKKLINTPQNKNKAYRFNTIFVTAKTPAVNEKAFVALLSFVYYIL